MCSVGWSPVNAEQISVNNTEQKNARFLPEFFPIPDPETPADAKAHEIQQFHDVYSHFYDAFLRIAPIVDHENLLFLLNHYIISSFLRFYKSLSRDQVVLVHRSVLYAT